MKGIQGDFYTLDFLKFPRMIVLHCPKRPLLVAMGKVRFLKEERPQIHF